MIGARTQQVLPGAPKLQISPSGRQHPAWAQRDWVYLESMAEVTPLLDLEVESFLELLHRLLPVQEVTKRLENRWAAVSNVQRQLSRSQKLLESGMTLPGRKLRRGEIHPPIFQLMHDYLLV
jgi:hypothetical protein